MINEGLDLRSNDKMKDYNSNEPTLNKNVNEEKELVYMINSPHPERGKD
jgi:hypothetical protein